MKQISTAKIVLILLLAVFSGLNSFAQNFTWAKNIGSAGNENGNSVKLDGSGYVYITGSFSGTVDFDPGAGVANLTSAGGTDIFLAKYNEFGTFQWAKRIGSGGNEVGTDLAVQTGGDVYLTGYFGSATVDFDPGAGTANLSSNGSNDIFFAKYNSDGLYVWAHSIGSSSDDFGNGIALDASGNLYLTGNLSGVADFDPSAGTTSLTPVGNVDFYFAKYDTSGAFSWAHNIGSAGLDAASVDIDIDGLDNVVITGSFQGIADFDPSVAVNTLTATGVSDIFLAKYTSAGVYVFADDMSGVLVASGLGVMADPSNNYYLTGGFMGTVDFDPGIGVSTLTAVGGQDIFIAKYTAAGTLMWVHSIGSATDDRGNNLFVDGVGDVYFTGSFSGTTDFDAGGGTANLTPSGASDMFFAKYDFNGIYVWAQNIGGTLGDEGLGITMDAENTDGGNIYLTGYFQNTADFDPGVGTTNLTSAGGNDIYLAKFNDCSVAPALPGAISGNIIPCFGGNYTYSIAAVPGATDYTWTLPSLWTGTSTQDSIIGNASPFSGTVTVAANNSCGVSATQTLTVTVGTVPSTPGAITGNTTMCAGSSNTYSVAAVVGATAYTWSLPAGWGGSSTSNSISTTASATTGTISVTASNVCGSSSPQTLGVTPVSIPAQPGAITGSATVCSGSSNTYSVTAVGGATSYTWSLPAGWGGASTTNSIGTTATGATGTMTVTANNICGTSPIRTKNVTVNSVPAVPGAITGNTTVCDGSNNVYSISSVPGASAYIWVMPATWGGFSNTTLLGATAHTNSGNVTVAASNSCGTSATSALSVTITTATPAPGPITGNTTMCQGTSNTYTIAAVGGATDYTWTLPGVDWTGTSTTTTLVVTAGATSGNISVVANDACGPSTPQTLAVNVSPTPATPGAISGNSTVCSGSANTYSVTAVGGATSYTWSLPAAWGGASITNSIATTATGATGTMSVTADNSCGSSSPQTLTVTVDNVVAAPGAITGNTTLCSGSSNTYSVGTVAGASSYTWTLPGGWGGASTSNSISTTASATTGTISVTANNSCGSSAAQSLGVTVSTVTAQPGAITGNTTMCQGSSNTFSIVAVGGATSYTWSMPAGWTGSSITTTLVGTASATSGTISVVANDLCGSSTPQTLSVTVSPVPVTPGAITGNTTVCAGSTNTYSIAAVGGATSYTWVIPGTWTGVSGTNSITTTAGASGGTISVTANNACGASPTQTLTVTVGASAAPVTPASIAGNATLCAGSSNTYSVSSVAGATSYTWVIPASWSGASTTNSIGTTASASGGTISVTANNVCGSSAPQTLPVSITSIPNQPGTITGNTTMCVGSSNTYSINPVAGASTYGWTLPGGWAGASVSTSIAATASGTTGTISVTANNVCGVSPPRTLTVNPNPVPSMPGAISGSLTVCSGSSHTYSVTAVGGATSYTWATPSGWSGSSVTNSIATTASSTNGNITVTANNACGSSAPQTLAVTTNSGAAQPGNISGLTAVCSGSTNLYSIAPVSGATSYSWILPGGWTGSSSLTSITAGANSSGGTIFVTANNSCGSSSPQQLNVTILSVPSQPGTISGNTTLCSGTSQTYSVAAITGAQSYNWSLPPGWSGSSTANSIFVVTGASSGAISVSASNICGTSPTRTLTVTSVSAPAQPGTIIGNVSPCIGSSQTYSVTSVPGVTSYNWTLPGWTGASSTSSIACSVTSSGNIIVSASNACGTSAIRTLGVYVLDVPVQPSTIVGNNAVCNGSYNTYSTPSMSGVASYNWTLPVGWSGTSSGNTINTYASSSSGNVSVAASNACGTSTAQNLSVTSTSVDTSVTQSGFTLHANLNAATYQWINCGTGFSVIGATSQSFTPSTGTLGSYKVMVTFNGCTDYSQCHLLNTGLGVQEHSLESSVSISPNPTTGKLILSVDGISFGKSTVEIYNIIGESVYKSTDELINQSTIDLSNQPSGVYFLNIRTKDGIVTRKFVKE